MGLFQLVAARNTDIVERVKKDYEKRMQELFSKFEHMFKEKNPEGLAPKRLVDHDIETEDGASPPHRPLFQIF